MSASRLNSSPDDSGPPTSHRPPGPVTGLPWTTGLVWLTVVTAAFAAVVGCSRGYYRNQADIEAYQLIREKILHPHWNIGRYGIAIDPRSRMFDPFDPDHPPMPADDPYAHTYMHRVDGKPGWPHWHNFGGTCLAENPYWLACLPTGADGCIELTADGSVRTAMLHSVEYQQALETLYLSALDVSAERFAFDAQFFNTTNLDYTADGPRRAGRPSPIPGPSSSQLSATNGFSVRKTYITGATFVANLTNSFLWEFSGPNQSSTFSLLDFTFIQPFLRDAGRERILETLTLSERTLLANVRRMQRFRQSFFIDILTGGGTANGPVRRGGFFGSSGLSGFTGLGSGGFGNIGGGGGAGGGFSGAGAGGGNVGGYLGLLQQQQQLRNLRSNIARLQVTLYELKESRDSSENQIAGDPEAAADTIADLAQQQLQVTQSQQAVFDNQGRLLNQQVTYENGLDNFKRLIGLPPQLCVNIADPMLDPFYLTDVTILPELEVVAQHLTTLRDVRDVLRDLKNDARRSIYARRRGIEDAEAEEFPDSLPGRRQRFLSVARAAATVDFSADDELLERADPEASARLQQATVELRRAADAARDRLRDDNFYRELLVYLRVQGQMGRLSAIERDLLEEELRDLGGVAEADAGNAFVAIERSLESVSREVRYWWDIVNRASLESTRRLAQQVPDLQAIDIDEATAFQIARHYRLDWMDNRAALVDRWRLIWFNADQLDSDLSLVFAGDVGTTGGNPLNFRSTTGRLRVGVQYDPPLTRLLERNNYRQSLIEYQQARREYYRYVDSVAQGLRAEIRQIEANKINYDIRLRAVLNAIQQVDTAELLVARRRSRNEINGPTAARDTVSALNDLQTSLDNFLSIVLNYEALRLQLDYDLGTMDLTNENLWVDPGPITPENNWSVPIYECPLPDPWDCYLPYVDRSDVRTTVESDAPDNLEEQLPAGTKDRSGQQMPNTLGGVGADSTPSRQPASPPTRPGTTLEPLPVPSPSDRPRASDRSEPPRPLTTPPSGAREAAPPAPVPTLEPTPRTTPPDPIVPAEELRPGAAGAPGVPAERASDEGAAARPDALQLLTPANAPGGTTSQSRSTTPGRLSFR